jgi:hypothetical protein
LSLVGGRTAGTSLVLKNYNGGSSFKEIQKESHPFLLNVVEDQENIPPPSNFLNENRLTFSAQKKMVVPPIVTSKKIAEQNITFQDYNSSKFNTNQSNRQNLF